MGKRALFLAVICTGGFAGQLVTWVAASTGSKQVLAPLWPEDVVEVFFEDARTHLVGPRPRPADDDLAWEVEPSAPRDFRWSSLLNAEAIEDEIKILQRAIDEGVTTAGAFKAGGYRDSHTQFSMLAVMFAIAAQYDDVVRWKGVASTWRDRFARVAINCKVGSDASYQQALQRKQDLKELILGNFGQVVAAKPIDMWSKVAVRTPLMRRLETAHRERITPWLQDRFQFRQHADNVVHESQIIATLAEIIQREDYEFWDDQAYADHAQGLKQAALQVIETARKDDYEGARHAVGQISKSCSGCHEGFRG